tara:strand:- start:1133 stop:1978 length:846 start_codon:yes stop_codon:yes gene_type:complete
MKKKCLIYVVCYNHEKFILKTLERIPQILSEYYDIEILVANDKSKDKTLEETKKFVTKHFKYNIISLYKNLGYGGNQKIGYYYSISNNFDYVVLLHGDGQYAPEYLPDILNKFEEKEKISAVFGSRMLKKGSALKGGMPLYKFVGNKILTFAQNLLLDVKLSEFHSGYRAYRVESLKKIFFQKNSDGYSFDTEIIIQLILNNLKIKEISIPTFYGDEISYVNGFKYAVQIMIETLKAYLFRKKIITIKKYKIADIQNDLELNNYNYEFKKTIEKSKFFKIN